MVLKEVSLDKYNKYLRIEVMKEFSKKSFSRELKISIINKYENDTDIQRKQRELKFRAGGKSKFVLSKVSEMQKSYYEELEMNYEDRIELNNSLLISLFQLGYKVDTRLHASDEKFIKENSLLLDVFGDAYLCTLEKGIQNRQELLKIIKNSLHSTMERTLKLKPKLLKVYRIEIPVKLSEEEQYSLSLIFKESELGKSLHNPRINIITRGETEIIIKFKTGAVIGVNQKRIKDLLSVRVVFEYDTRFGIKKNIDNLYTELSGISAYTKLLEYEFDYIAAIYSFFYDTRNKRNFILN